MKRVFLVLALLAVTTPAFAATVRPERPARDRDVPTPPPVVVVPPAPAPAPVVKCSWTVSPDLGYGVKIPKNTPTTFSWYALPGAVSYVVVNENNVVVATTSTGSITRPAQGYMFYYMTATYDHSPWNATCGISRSSQY